MDRNAAIGRAAVDLSLVSSMLEGPIFAWRRTTHVGGVLRGLFHMLQFPDFIKRCRGVVTGDMRGRIVSH